MKVKDLIAELQGLDGEMLVVLQKDAEGKGYSPLAGADPSAGYVPECDWSGYVGLMKLTPEDVANGFSEEDLAGEDAIPCVVLWPIN